MPSTGRSVIQRPKHLISGDKKCWSLHFTEKELETTDVSLLTKLVMGPRWAHGVFQQKVLGYSRLEHFLLVHRVGSIRPAFGILLWQSLAI